MKKISLFWKIYFGVVIVAIAGIVTLWCVLWSFLSAYEKSRVEHKIEEVVDLFNNADADELSQYLSYEVSPLEEEDEVRTAMVDNLRNQLQDGEWTYTKKSGEYTKEAPVYVMKKNGTKTDITVYISLDDKRGKFKTPNWKLTAITGMEMAPATNEFIVPKGSKVIYNDHELDESYIVENDIEDPTLQNVDKYIEEPKLTRYKVSGVYTDFTVVAKGPVYSSILNLISNDENEENVLRFGFESNDEFDSYQEPRIIDITKIYGKYVMNYVKFSELSPYIYKNSYAYDYLSKVSLTNKWHELSKAPEFRDLEVFNYQIYTDDCFSCEVKFTEVVYQGGTEHEYPTHLQYIFLKQNSNWYLADIIMRKA